MMAELSGANEKTVLGLQRYDRRPPVVPADLYPFNQLGRQSAGNACKPNSGRSLNREELEILNSARIDHHIPTGWTRPGRGRARVAMPTRPAPKRKTLCACTREPIREFISRCLTWLSTDSISRIRMGRMLPIDGPVIMVRQSPGHATDLSSQSGTCYDCFPECFHGIEKVP